VAVHLTELKQYKEIKCLLNPPRGPRDFGILAAALSVDDRSPSKMKEAAN
jgi:hypothetical protein